MGESPQTSSDLGRGIRAQAGTRWARRGSRGQERKRQHKGGQTDGVDRRTTGPITKEQPGWAGVLLEGSRTRQPPGPKLGTLPTPRAPLPHRSAAIRAAGSTLKSTAAEHSGSSWKVRLVPLLLLHVHSRGLPEMTLLGPAQARSSRVELKPPDPLCSLITQPSSLSEPAVDTLGQVGSERDGNIHRPCRVSPAGSGKTSQRVSKTSSESIHTSWETRWGHNWGPV